MTKKEVSQGTLFSVNFNNADKSLAFLLSQDQKVSFVEVNGEDKLVLIEGKRIQAKGSYQFENTRGNWDTSLFVDTDHRHEAAFVIHNINKDSSGECLGSIQRSVIVKLESTRSQNSLIF